jgi:hypothetical protein
MSRYYKIWLNIEEIDEEKDIYEDIESEVSSVGPEFERFKDAKDFKNKLEDAGGMISNICETCCDCCKNCQDKASITWTVDDVFHFAKELKLADFSRDDAREVLYLVIENHDADRGINWNVIENTINYYVKKKN